MSNDWQKDYMSYDEKIKADEARRLKAAIENGDLSDQDRLRLAELAKLKKRNRLMFPLILLCVFAAQLIHCFCLMSFGWWPRFLTTLIDIAPLYFVHRFNASRARYRDEAGIDRSPFVCTLLNGLAYVSMFVLSVLLYIIAATLVALVLGH